ncbi:ST43 protein [Escherichia coli O26:H11]|nr:ST43 protein [Escherichia coli O26:H11]
MSLPDVDMSNPTSNSGKFMDKKLQALVNEPPPSCSIPLFHHLLQYLFQ